MSSNTLKKKTKINYIVTNIAAEDSWHIFFAHSRLISTKSKMWIDFASNTFNGNTPFSTDASFYRGPGVNLGLLLGGQEIKGIWPMSFKTKEEAQYYLDKLLEFKYIPHEY